MPTVPALNARASPIHKALGGISLVYLEGTLYMQISLVEKRRDIMPIYRHKVPPTLKEQV
jgi:hypothetical protein